MIRYIYKGNYANDYYDLLVQELFKEKDEFYGFKKINDALIYTKIVAGCDKEDIKVQVSKRSSIVKLELKEDGEYTDAFKMKFDLSHLAHNLDLDKISKDVTDGVLKVRIPIIEDEFNEVK